MRHIYHIIDPHYNVSLVLLDFNFSRQGAAHGADSRLFSVVSSNITATVVVDRYLES